jgi:hypothetical protein
MRRIIKVTNRKKEKATKKGKTLSPNALPWKNDGRNQLIGRLWIYAIPKQLSYRSYRSPPKARH